MGMAGQTLQEQWAIWQGRFTRSRNAGLFIAYLQSFSNTYGPASRLRRLLLELRGLEGNVGVSVGTRPDCLDAEKLDIIAASGLEETWLELGVQTAHDATLRRINRGHDAASSAWAIHEAAARGIRVCAHVIFGLPGEDRAMMLETVDWLNSLPVFGVKFHALYVCRDTPLAGQWRAGAFEPLEQARYAEVMVEALARLRSEVVVHRLVGEPAGDELLAPAWAADKRASARLIQDALESRGLWQGCLTDAPQRPLWFDSPADQPRSGSERKRRKGPQPAGGPVAVREEEYAALCARQPFYLPVSAG